MIPYIENVDYDFQYVKTPPTKWSPRPKQTTRRTLSERKQRRAARHARASR
jgi:hypothetical protein